MSPFLVSVIIPVYNSESTLAQTVASVEAQSNPLIEVILIDDGSTDGSAGLVDQLVEANSNVRAVHVRNGGVSRARNIGLEEAGGEYVMFLDADDLLAPDAIEVLVDDALSSCAAIVVCGMSFDTLGEDGRVARSVMRTSGWSGKIDDFAHADCAYGRLYEANYAQSAYAKLFRSEELRTCGIKFDDSLSSYEDHVFVLDCFACMPPVFIDERVLYHYCLRPGYSNSTRFKADMSDQMARVAERELAFYEKTLLAPCCEDAFCHVIQYLIVAVNNAERAANSNRKGELSRLFAMPVFEEAAKRAVAFPNNYSRFVVKLGARGGFSLILLLAFLRNAARGMR